MEILEAFSITRGEPWWDVFGIAGNLSLWFLGGGFARRTA
jgi:hypothetical protein